MRLPETLAGAVDAGEQLLGYPREKYIGKDVHDMFPKEEADFFRQKDVEMFTRGAKVENSRRASSSCAIAIARRHFS